MRRNGLLVIIAVVTCFAPLRAHIAHENPARRGVQPEQHHLSPEVKVSLSASGTVTREEFSGARSSLMRRDLNYDDTIQDEDAGADAGDPDSDAESDEAEDNDDAKEPAACDSGGETTYRSPRSFQVEAPTQVPFTLSLRMRWTGDSPPDLTPNPACVICWTIDPDTTPSTNKEQFYQGLDGQPPRIALMRMGNVLNYEEYGADGGTGTVNLFTSASCPEPSSSTTESTTRLSLFAGSPGLHYGLMGSLIPSLADKQKATTSKTRIFPWASRMPLLARPRHRTSTCGSK